MLFLLLVLLQLLPRLWYDLAAGAHRSTLPVLTSLPIAIGHSNRYHVTEFTEKRRLPYIWGRLCPVGTRGTSGIIQMAVSVSRAVTLLQSAETPSPDQQQAATSSSSASGAAGSIDSSDVLFFFCKKLSIYAIRQLLVRFHALR